MKVDEQFSKCLLVTNYRTGSTSFCIQNKAEHIFNNFEILKNTTVEHACEKIQRQPASISKIMPDQFDHDISKFEKLHEHITDLVYLYRKDFTAQCKSWIAWNFSSDHLFHYGGTRTYHIDCTQQQAEPYIDQLLENYNTIKKLYKLYPGPVYAYEDIQNNKPYNRVYNWKNHIQIPEYNTGEIFND